MDPHLSFLAHALHTGTFLMINTTNLALSHPLPTKHDGIYGVGLSFTIIISRKKAQ